MKGVVKSLVFLICLITISNAQGDKNKSDKELIIEAGLNYVVGYFESDVERMKKSIHPELTKVHPGRFPGQMNDNFNTMNSETLFRYAKMNTVRLKKDEKVEVKVLDINGDLASAVVISPSYIDYTQMAKIKGVWKIINVMWKLRDKN